MASSCDVCGYRNSEARHMTPTLSSYMALVDTLSAKYGSTTCDRENSKTSFMVAAVLSLCKESSVLFADQPGIPIGKAVTLCFT